MKHLGTKTLETGRLLLRRFTMEDAEAMYRNWCSDPEVTKYLMWPAHESVDVTRSVLADWTAQYEKEGFYLWAICLKDNEAEPIGSISAVGQDDRTKMVHIGYCIGKGWWGRGMMTEALKGLIGFFFDEVGINRIESRHAPENPGSGMVMKKAGMAYEGTSRQSDWNNQGISDAVHYAILAEDCRG